jgi:CDP-glycerol glycerophosphotransferase (TagB/SpsB family)
MKKKQKILLLLPSGMTVRNFLYTNVTQLLLENKNVEILCCVDNPQRYNHLFLDKRISFINFVKKRSSSFSNILLTIVRRRTEMIYENKSIKILREGPFKKNFLVNIEFFPAYPFPRSIMILKFFKFLLNKLYIPNKEIVKILDRFQPNLVVATHVVNRFEYDYLRVAKKNGVKTMGMVKSFDNLTSKGIIPLQLDFFIAWNEIIKKELVDMYKYKKENIFVTGIPQFDLYSEDPKISKEDFFKNLNLSAKKHTILFATNSESIGIDDPEIVKLIASHLDELNAQLIVRIHPTDNFQRYSNMHFRDVYFDIAGIDNGASSHDRVSSKLFISDLRDVLYFSDVVINTCSTMTLDAISIHKPVINIYFDFMKRDYNESILRYYDLIHYRPIMDAKSTCLATSRQKLISLLIDCINNPEIAANERALVERTMLNGNKGDAAKNISKAVLGVLDLS